MNKKLLTLAVGAALVATTGIASADMNWYGRMNMAIAGGDANANEKMDIRSGGSRFGWRASEDLGNGMEAFVWQEFSINPSDGGSAVVGHRDALVGVKGDFGSVAAGRAASPIKLVGVALDLFGDTVGDANQGGSLITQPEDTAISYGNSFDGIDISIAYVPENAQNQPTDEDTAITGSIGYSADAFEAAVGMISGEDYDITLIRGAYKMDNMKFILGYQMRDIASVEDTVLTVGATVGFGDGFTGKVQWTDLDHDVDAADGSLTALGVSKSLSKNVSAGVVYATDDSYGQDKSSWDVGMTVNF